MYFSYKIKNLNTKFVEVEEISINGELKKLILYIESKNGKPHLIGYSGDPKAPSQSLSYYNFQQEKWFREDPKDWLSEYFLIVADICEKYSLEKYIEIDNSFLINLLLNDSREIRDSATEMLENFELEKSIKG